MNDSTTLKRCTKCRDEFPATSEHFGKHKQCKNGLNPVCKACNKAMCHQYYAQHSEAIKKNTKNYAEKHREQTRLYKREWNRDHLAYVRNTAKTYLQRHPDNLKKWRHSNPEKHRAQLHRRRAHKHNAVGSHTDMDITILYINQNGKCIYCGCVLGKKYHVDHVVPLSRGGSNDFDNLALACPHCNSSKGAKLLSEWRR